LLTNREPAPGRSARADAARFRSDEMPATRVVRDRRPDMQVPSTTYIAAANENTKKQTGFDENVKNVYNVARQRGGQTDKPEAAWQKS
jgi:hypothetical protein